MRQQIKQLTQQYPQVFFQLGLAALLIGVMLVASLLVGDVLVDIMRSVNEAILAYFGGFYLWLVFLILIAFVAIGISPLGKIRLGGPDARPEHSLISWLSMLFCTGMGVGFMFWGAAEPLYHFMNPPYADSVTQAEKMTVAFNYAFLHWALEPWAIFGLSALVIGFWGFNLNRGFYFSSFFRRHQEPGSPKRAEAVGEAPKTRAPFLLRCLPDVVTVLAIAFGIATTVGLGVLQVEGALQSLFNISGPPVFRLAIVAVIAGIFMSSIFLGLDKGLKVLSNTSVIINVTLLLAMLSLGPTWEILPQLFRAVPSYISHLTDLSLGWGTFREAGWVNHWTIKTWSWTITWGPFVGLFIALISKGRTLRELCLGVMMIPALYTFVWFTTFGYSAIDLQLSEGFVGASLSLDQASVVLFELLKHQAGGFYLSLLSLMVLIVFISNSVDSACYTMTRFVEHDVEERHMPVLQLMWGFVFAALTGLLVVTGGLPLLHQITQVTALPFSLMLSVIFVRVIRELLKESGKERALRKDPPPLVQPQA